VTGASSGLGAVFADRLAARGDAVLLIGRDSGRLEARAAALRAAHGVPAETLVADLTEPQALRALSARLSAEQDLAVLVNCAGFGGSGPFAELVPDQVDALVAIHVTAVARLTHAAVQAFRARGSGAVVNVASLLAFSAAMPRGRLADRALYAGGKSFIVTFSQTLARELEGTGIQIQACVPGIVDTPFSHGPDAAPPPAHMVMAPEEVVAASLAALELGEAVCVPGLENRELLDRLGELQLDLLLAGNQNHRAARYH
jgi:short-subunit dehydrogenase